MSARSLIAAASLGLAASGAASAGEAVTFATNWLAQAEHGGFYQAVADGTYAACGLDVTILMGGPQVNNRALLLAGKIDYNMGGNILGAFNAAAEGIPVVVVASAFQKEPQVIIAHPGEAETFDDLKNLTLLISDEGFQSYYQWMIAEKGFTAAQREPYTFSAAPFLADKKKAMQGYLTSEPYAIQQEAGFEPKVFLIADAGYGDYSTTIEAMRETVETKPDQVKCFVDGSIKGWYNFLYGDNAAAIALIQRDNPDMTDDKIAYAVAKLKSAGIVDSGDALTMGIGALNEAKVQDFFERMVEAGVVKGDVDWRSAIDFSFVNQKVGMELKK